MSLIAREIGPTEPEASEALCRDVVLGIVQQLRPYVGRSQGLWAVQHETLRRATVTFLRHCHERHSDAFRFDVGDSKR